MPKLTGLFGSFENLDLISAEDIAYWLKSVPQLNVLENYLANKILYPQVIPQTERDMQMDLAILREALRRSKQSNTLHYENRFLNTTLRKLLIPVEFLNFVPDLASLTWAFTDALLLGRKKETLYGDLWTVVLTGGVDEVVGSVILPQFGSGGLMTLQLMGKNYQISQGSLIIIPCPKERCEVAYRLQNGKVLGKSESAIEVYGGKLGLMIDGRGA